MSELRTPDVTNDVAGPTDRATLGAAGREAAEPMSADAHGQATQIRGSALLLAGTLLASAVEFISQIILVRYLSKDVFGAWSYALAIVALFVGIAQFEMRNAASRYIPIYLERGETRKLVGTIGLSLGVALGLGALIAVALAAALGPLGIRPTGDPRAIHLLILIAALIPIQAVDSVFTGLFAAFGASKTIFLRQSVLAPALRLSLVVGLVVAGAGIDVLAIGYVVATLLGVLLYVTSLVRVLHANGIRPIIRDRGWDIPVREVLTFAAPLLTTTVVWMLMESSDAILLGYFHDPAAVANFRVVLPLARMNAIVSAVFSVLYLPMASRAFERSDGASLRDLYWRTALWMTVLSFPVLLITSSFSQSVTVGLYGSAYASSAPILALLAIGYFFNTALGFNGLTVKVYGKLRQTVAIDVVAAISNVVINLLLIPRFGPIGAAVGTCATLILHNVLKHLALARLTDVPWFERRYAWIYLGLAAIAVGLLVVEIVTPHTLIIAIVASGIGGILGVVVSRRYLDLRLFFPELDRLPLPKWLLSFIAPHDAAP